MAGNHHFQRAGCLSGALLLLTLSACRDKEKERAQAPNPCLSQALPVLAFDFVDRLGIATPDTAILGDVAFVGPGAPYTTYEWQVGTDPRVFTQKRFGLFFGTANLYRTIPVRLIARRPPNLACFAKDDGVDTLTKALTIMPYASASSPILGRFHGANLDAPADTFTVRITAEPDRRFPGIPNAPPTVYLHNLPNKVCPFTINEQVSGGWRGILIDGIGCGGAYGTALLDDDRRTLRITYSMVNLPNPARLDRVFVGRRVR